MFWIALIVMIFAILNFMVALLPSIAIDISTMSATILSGLDYILSYSGLLCFLLPMENVKVCLTLLISWIILETTYYGILYVVKIFK